MAITKTSATFVLLIILAASLSNFNVLASGIFLISTYFNCS